MGDSNNSLCASGDKNRYWCNRGLGSWEKCRCDEFVSNHVEGPRQHMVILFENKAELLQYHRVTDESEMSHEVKISIGLTGAHAEKLRTDRSYYQMGAQAEAKMEWLPFSLGRAGRVGMSLLSNTINFHKTTDEQQRGYLFRPGATWEFPLIVDYKDFGWTLDLGAHGGVPLNVPDRQAVYSVEGGLNLYFFKYPDLQPIFSIRTQYLTRDYLNDGNNWLASFHAGVGL